MTKYGQFYNRKQYLLFSNWTRFSWYGDKTTIIEGMFDEIEIRKILIYVVEGPVYMEWATPV